MLGVCDDGVDAASISYIWTEEKNMDWGFFLDREDVLLFSCGASVESDCVIWFADLAHDTQVVIQSPVKYFLEVSALQTVSSNNFLDGPV